MPSIDNILATMQRQQARLDELALQLTDAHAQIATLQDARAAGQDLAVRQSRTDERVDTTDRLARANEQALTTLRLQTNTQQAAISAAAQTADAANQAATDAQARLAALPPADAAISDVLTRLSRVGEQQDATDRLARATDQAVAALRTQTDGQSTALSQVAQTADAATLAATTAQARIAGLSTPDSAITDLLTRQSRTDEKADAAVRARDDTDRANAVLRDDLQQAVNTARDALSQVLQLHATVSTLDARLTGLPAPDAELAGVRLRLDQLAAQQATVAARDADNLRAVRDTTTQAVSAVQGQLDQLTAQQSRDAAAAESMVTVLSQQVAALADRGGDSSGVPLDQFSQLADKVGNLDQRFFADPTLVTALTRKGLQVGDAAITALTATKLTGNVAAAQMTANIIASINASAGGADAGKITTGDLPAAQLQTNVVSALNTAGTGVNAAVVTTGTLGGSVAVNGANLTAGDVPTARLTTNIVASVNTSAGGVDAGKVTTGTLGGSVAVNGANLTAGDIATARLTTNITAAFNTATGKDASKLTVGDLGLGAGQKVGLYGVAPVAQPTVTNFTNNIASGGTSNQNADYTIVDYATDSATIKANLYQQARTMNLILAALKLPGYLG